MAKKIYDDIINKHQDWGGDDSTSNLPVSGKRVQEFIKNTLDSKVGTIYYDATANRYLVFADNESRDLYINDTTQTNLILGTFDAPFNYSAVINLLSKPNNTIFTGTTGNYIEFTFDTTNKTGASVGETVICTYTFIRNSTKQVVTTKYNYGEQVKFLIDEYLQEGTTTITVGIQGQNTLAATTTAVVYKVINLSISDAFDISKPIKQTLEIPYTVTGQGTKTIHWYIDNVEQDYIKDEDEITEYTSERTKFIDIALNDGIHTLQIQATTLVDGESFSSDILYREFIVSNTTEDIYIACKYTIPASKGLNTTGTNILYDINQYTEYTLYFAVYNGTLPLYTPVRLYLDDDLQTTIQAENNSLQSFSFTQYSPKDIVLKIEAGDTVKEIQGKVNGSTLNIDEITSGLTLAFSGTGMSNSSATKDKWSYNTYIGTLKNFYYNNVSGWVDNALLINSNASFNINYAPLSQPETFGTTIEFSLRTLNVSDDNTVICDMTNNGVGLKITASEAILTSREGSTVSTKFKSEEDVRISFVINKHSGTTNRGLAFIYINGILSGATRFANTDTFASNKQILLQGTSSAEIKLYQIRVYEAALSHDQILNNYILYQKTDKLLQEVYYKNDVLENNSLSVNKLERFLPVMIVTGNIPVLENTNNKKEQITVDIEYINLQDPTKSFTMKKAAMTPQGTSSMSYPKKNFKIYTQKIEDTIVYDYNGNVIEDKLYSFKDNAQPVQTWCLKADYAESSSTHNTGVARLWNEVLYNTQIDGEYKLRTEAQKAALKNNYNYDVRTTVDGFPILMFYRLTENSDLIFIGKYNFNNDKSTESVFGFRDIPGFDNAHMQCWEVLNNGHHLALFTDTNNWNTEWSDAFEGRYPDSSEDTTDLKAFAEWLVSCKNNPTKFSTEKYDHLNVYLVAAYYIYIIRFGAVDQVVKNAMLTSEDGKHFYFINYDNDTIFAVRNDGLLIYAPTITRQTLDPSYTTEVYAYAGHDSTLWNLLEADSDFMNIVSTVDNALYQAGLRYDNVIDMFDNKQSKKWCERIYNQDAQYKYIGPYVNDGVNNLFMLQGSRESHRKWWVSRRFNLVDSWFVSGAYKSNVLECKMASAPIGIQFSITAGFDMNYGYGVNNVPVSTGIALKVGESTTFTTKQVLNLGDPMRIYSANNLQGVDLSGFISYLSTVNVAPVYDSILGTQLKTIILGDGVSTNTSLSEIQGITSAKRLEKLDIQGYKAMSSLDLSQANMLKELNANNSGLKSVTFADGNPLLTTIKLPNTMQSLVLKDLPNITTFSIQDNSELLSIDITGCPTLSSYSAISPIINANKSTLTTLTLDNINWSITVEQLLSLVQDIDCNFKGKVTLSSINQEQIDLLRDKFGNTVFSPSSAFYISAPGGIFLSGPDTLLEGNNGQYVATVFTQDEILNKIYYKVSTRNGVAIDDKGLLTTTENGLSTGNVTITVQYVDNNNNILQTFKQVQIQKRVYPTAAQLKSAIKYDSLNFQDVNEEHSYKLEFDDTITGRFNIAWSIENNDYLEIVSTLNDVCKVRLKKITEGTLNVNLKVVLTKVVGGNTTEATLTLVSKNSNVAITKTENPMVMAKLYDAGLCANENYMTYTECALITDEEFAKVSFNNYNYVTGTAWTFDEFQYFTSVTKIPNADFQYSTLTHITFPPNIISIGDSAFQNLRKDCEIIFNDKVTTFGSNTFNMGYPGKLINFRLPKSVTTLGAHCFSSCSNFTEIDLSNISTIPGYCFSSCTSLSKVKLAENSTLGSYAFTNCTSLTNIESGSLQKVWDNAFNNCSSLASINLHGTDVVSDAFPNCTSLSDVYIDDTTNFTNMSSSTLNTFTADSPNYYVTIDTEPYWGFYKSGSTTYTDMILFNGCNKIKFHVTGTIYRNIHNAVYRDNTLILFRGGDLVDEFILSPETKFISNFAFAFQNIKTFTFDSSQTQKLVAVMGAAFMGSSVEIINLPTTTKYIGDSSVYQSEIYRKGYQFKGCNIKEFNIPEAVYMIPYNGFRECKSLEKITFPASSILIGSYAFASCSNLSTIISKSTTAPSHSSSVYIFGNTADSSGTTYNNYGQYTGYESRGEGTVNKLYVPAGATGYEEGYWLDPLCNADKCGFTISKTL